MQVRPPHPRSSSGFTLMELVVVILLVGIMAAFTAPRINTAAFRSSGYYQQVLSSIRYAQKLAIASGCDVQVTIAAASCTVTWNDCGTGSPANGTSVANPASGLNDFCASSAAMSVTGDTVTFDPIGRPDAAGSVTIDGRPIAVEAETGYAHEP